MTIGIDIRVLARGTHTGVEEYVLNLLEWLLPQAKNHQIKLFYNGFNKVKLQYGWLELPNVKLCEFKIPNRPLFFSSRYFGLPKIDYLLDGVDVYFNPHFFTAPLSTGCRKVMTFHDLSFEYFPQFFSLRKRIWQKLLMSTKQEALNASQIIAVSDSTKQDLVNLYGVAENKIRVIYSGISENFKPQLPNKKIKQKYDLPDKYILYFGTLEPRKNLITLIKAFSLLRTKHNIKLVIAGNKGWLYKKIFAEAATSRYQSDIIFTGFVDQNDKPALYNLAELFVYPSYFEGFGFPPLEAMACGIPTIVSHSSSLPEVVGSGAIMVNPYNIDELAWAMDSVLSENITQQILKEQGRKQAAKFSWQECTRQTLAVLEGK